MIKAILKKEVQCLFSSPQTVWVALTFCLGVFLIFPFVLDLEAAALTSLFPALLWISIFFSLFLTIEGFYTVDYVHHIFHHLYTKGESFFSLILLKSLMQSAFVFLIHLALMPLFSLFYQIDLFLSFACIPYLVLGVLSLSFLVHFAHILILALNQRGMLALLVLLPLIVPILIFGSSACHLTLMHEAVEAPVYYLAGIFLLTLGVLPYTSSLILTEAVKQ